VAAVPTTAPAASDDEDDPAASVAPARYIEVASESLATMRTSLTRGLDELKNARENKDAVELTCVNENVTAMKGILRVSEDALVSLQEADGAKDGARARHEFRKIQVSKGKMDDLLQAALNCTDADTTTTNTSVVLEVDESLATIDPYYGDTSFFFDPASALVEGEASIIDEDPPEVRPPPSSDVLF
jgi:hypothetical protein